MKKLILLIVLSIPFLNTEAQTEKRYIEVLGSAESEINPDIIIISVRLKEYEENKEKVNLDKIERDFTSALTKSKIDKENITLSDLTINSIQQRKKERDFYSQKTYQIKFSKTEDILVLIENLKSVKLDNLTIVMLSHSHIEKYRLETKIEALKVAEKKAEALLNAVGAKRGKPLLIDETPEQFTSWPKNADSNISYNIIDSEFTGASEIQLKKIKLRFEILARFEIE